MITSSFTHTQPFCLLEPIWLHLIQRYRRHNRILLRRCVFLLRNELNPDHILSDSKYVDAERIKRESLVLLKQKKYADYIEAINRADQKAADELMSLRWRPDHAVAGM